MKYRPTEDDFEMVKEVNSAIKQGMSLMYHPDYAKKGYYYKVLNIGKRYVSLQGERRNIKTGEIKKAVFFEPVWGTVTFIDRDDNQIVVDMGNKQGYTSVAINGKTVFSHTLRSLHAPKR